MSAVDSVGHHVGGGRVVSPERRGQTPTISVVIPVHDGVDVLGEQLDALSRQVDAPDFDVVVVLNRCRDASGEVARSYDGRLRIRTVVADDRANVSYARNVGWRASAGRLVLFCDADDRVAPGWVSGMVEPLIAQQADLVGGRVTVDRGRFRLGRRWFYAAHYHWLDGACLHQHEPSWPLGATLGIRREALEAVGGYEEFLERSGEEVWLTRMVVRAGFRVGPAPNADLLYRPRTTLRSFLRQYSGYARSSARMGILEGRRTRGAPRTQFGVVARATRKAARAVVRKGVLDPRRILMIWVWNHGTWDELRSLSGLRHPREVDEDDAT